MASYGLQGDALGEHEHEVMSNEVISLFFFLPVTARPDHSE